MSRNPGAILLNEMDDNTLILRGGIGTGKTTTLKKFFQEIIQKPRHCQYSKEERNYCTKTPRYFELDYRTAISPNSESETELFWLFTESELHKQYESLRKKDYNLIEFLDWCLNKVNIIRNEKDIQGFVLRHHKQFMALKDQNRDRETYKRISSEILNDLDMFLQNCTVKTRAWYALFLLAYLIGLDDKSIDHHCNYILVDNIDHFSPNLQGDAILFAYKLTEILSARTVIAVRPLTYSNLRHYHFMVTKVDHRSPSCFDVINARYEDFLKIYQDGLSEKETAYIKDILSVMTSRPYHSIYPKLVWASSGLSIRYATRNIRYMLNSPIIIDYLCEELENSKKINYQYDARSTVSKIKTGRIARAYFHGESDGLKLDRFQNLYSVGGESILYCSCSLIKPRILDFIQRIMRGKCSIIELFTYLGLFGYHEKDISIAINDLLDNKRSLIWSSEGLECDDLKSKNDLSITSLGQGYYNVLFGEYCYVESCLAQTLSKSLKPREIFDFHKKIEELDLNEIKTFCENRSSQEYRKLYDKDIPALSYLHAKRISEGYEKRKEEREAISDIHKGRENYVEFNVNNILNDIANTIYDILLNNMNNVLYQNCVGDGKSMHIGKDGKHKMYPTKNSGINIFFDTKVDSNVNTEQVVKINIDLKCDLPALQNEFTQFKKEVSNLDENLNNKLKEIEDDLLTVTPNSEQGKINKAVNKLRVFLIELDDKNSNFYKIISGAKNGIATLQKIGKTYNKFAQWLALPTVPEIFFGV